MKKRGFGFLSVFLALGTSAACASLSRDGASLGGPSGGGAGTTGGLRADPPTWSLPEAQDDWSHAGGAAPVANDGTCSFGEPTTVHLALPGFRSFASAPLSRALTKAQLLPDPQRVRASDFLNYYRVRYDDAPVDTDLAFHAGVEPGTLPTELVLQIAVQAPVKYDRPPVALAVVVDTSLSMAGAPWKRAKAAASALAAAMIPGDTFTLVTAKRALQSAGDPAAAAALADALALDAGEDLAGALGDAYQSVSSSLKGSTAGRVVLISDGAAQPTSIDLGLVASHFQQQGVPLIGVGVGEAASYQSDFLDAATANGGGANLYLDSEAEAASLLRDRFDELMIPVATDIEVIVSLPPSLRFQTLREPAMADAPTGLVTATLHAGRTLVLRNVLETCEPSIGDVLALPVGITVRYRRPGDAGLTDSPNLGGFLADLKHLTTPQILEAGVIADYAAALATARVPLLKQAAEASFSARQTEPALFDDPDLIEIEALIAADLALIEAAAPGN